MPKRIGDHKLLSFASIVDDNTIEQAIETASVPFIHPHVALMPDAHSGKGSAVGTVIPTIDAVIPAAVGVDIGCLDRDTEVLTQEGWVRIAEWGGSEILIYQPDSDEAWFEKPERYIVEDCAEFFHFKNSKGLDQMLSAEHRIPVWSGFKARGYNFSVKSPAELSSLGLSSGFHCFKATFTPVGSEVDLTDDMIRVEVMVQADGRVRHFGGEPYVELHLRKERKVERAEKLLANAGLNYSITEHPDASVTISFSAKTGQCSKDLGQFWTASAGQLGVIAEESLQWDGHSGYRSHYTSTDRDSADLIQYAFAASGVRAGIHSRPGQKGNHATTHHVTPTKNEMVGFSDPVVVPSVDGKKYCFTVGTGFFVARRNGKIFITGNCGVVGVLTIYTEHDLVNKSLSELRESLESAIPLSPGNYNKSVDRFDFTAARIAYLEELSEGVDLSHSPRWREQLGSLGGGNHFIELCIDELGRVWMLLHSGSRGVGNKIAQKHIKAAQKLMKQFHIQLPNADLAYLPQGTPEFASYLKELNWAQKFAYENRAEMMDRFRQALAHWMWFGGDPAEQELERINNHHNYTRKEVHFGKDVWLTRKGAVDAHEGVRAVIPGSMGTKTYIVRGRGNAAGLCSAPHGAGRKFSRTEARRRFTADDLADRMKGIEYRHGDEWIDEIPDAYKDVDQVIEDAKDLVEVEHVLRQVLNVKGT